jgi:hypothetical protein
MCKKMTAASSSPPASTTTLSMSHLRIIEVPTRWKVRWPPGRSHVRWPFVWGQKAWLAPASDRNGRPFPYVSGPRAYEGRPGPRHGDEQVLRQSSIAAGRGHGRMKAGIFRTRFAHGAMSADAAAGEAVARSQKLSGGPPSRAGESRGNRTSPSPIAPRKSASGFEATPSDRKSLRRYCR